MSIDPTRVYALALNYITAKVVLLAAKLRLDEQLSDTPITIEELSSRLFLEASSFKRFLRVLDAHNIIRLSQNLVSKTDETDSLRFVRTPHLSKAYSALDELEYTLKTNNACWDKVYGDSFYSSLSENELEEFADWCKMGAEQWLGSIATLYDFTQFSKIVDVGGGQGYLLAELLSHNLQQTGVLFDQPEVVAHADKVLASYSCLDRVDVIGGDFFVEVPGNGDCYIICRTLLNWSDNDSTKILNTCYSAMNSNATLLIIDFLLPEKAHPHYLRTTLSDVNLMAIINSKNRDEEEWIALVNQSKLKLKNVFISDDTVKPEPFSPIIILECVK
jgi:hypothetical protein